MTWSAHVVVAVVVEQDGKFLLVEEDIGGSHVLNQPAGHWETGETLLAAAQREALEETGWDVEPTQLLGVYEFKPPDLDYTFLRFAFIAKALRHHPKRPLDDGIVRALWLSAEELRRCAIAHRGPAVMRCVDDYLAGQHYPLQMIAHLTHCA